MKYSMPERLRSSVSAVSSAPHSFPFAYHTCCIRLSFESSVPSDWCGGAGGRRRICQQPGPKGVGSVRSFRQSASGVDPAFWLARAGTPYSPTFSTLLCSCRSGSAESSEDVLVSDHTTSSSDVRGPVQPVGHVASSVAFELRKYSVPPPPVWYWLGGEFAGHTVNPGWPCTVFFVSRST